MSPTPCTRSPDSAPPAPPTRRRPAAGPVIGVAFLLTLAGCAQFTRDSNRLARQVQEASCVSTCRETKERCDNDARYQYQQCQAGYDTAQKDYRWCNADGWRTCGYPWWSCSENLYGYCTNRFRECRAACRTPRG